MNQKYPTHHHPQDNPGSLSYNSDQFNMPQNNSFQRADTNKNPNLYPQNYSNLASNPHTQGPSDPYTKRKIFVPHNQASINPLAEDLLFNEPTQIIRRSPRNIKQPESANIRYPPQNRNPNAYSDQQGYAKRSHQTHPNTHISPKNLHTRQREDHPNQDPDNQNSPNFYNPSSIQTTREHDDETSPFISGPRPTVNHPPQSNVQMYYNPPVQNPAVRRNVESFGNINPQYSHQQYNFQISGTTHPDLDASYSSISTTRTVPRKRTKPIVNMNINIGNGKYDEIQVYEGQDPFNAAQDFCQKYNLPPNLAKVLADNIAVQVNNYYVYKAQKIRRPILPLYGAQGMQQYPTQMGPMVHNQEVVNNFYPQMDIDPRMSEKASLTQPLPHLCPENPALKQSIVEDDPEGPPSFRANNASEVQYSIADSESSHRNQYNSQNQGYRDSFQGNLTQGRSSKDTGRTSSGKKLDRHQERTSATETYSHKDESQDIEDQESEEVIDEAEIRKLQEIEHEIQQLQKKKETYLNKFNKKLTIDADLPKQQIPMIRPNTTKASTVSPLNFNNEHQSRLPRNENIQRDELTLRDISGSPNGSLTRIENIHIKPLTTKNSQIRPSVHDKLYDQAKLKQQRTSSRSPMRSSDKPSLMNSKATKVSLQPAQAERQPYRNVTSYKEIHQENEARKRSVSQTRVQNSAQNGRSKSPKPVGKLKPSISPRAQRKSSPPRVQRLQLSSKENVKQSPNVVTQPSQQVSRELSAVDRGKSSNLTAVTESAQRQSSIGTSYSAELSEEEDIKRKVLGEIFKSLDDDLDDSISMDKVDISGLHPEILEGMPEVFAALEEGMVLTFQDFYNIINHRRLFDQIKKVYSLNSNNSEIRRASAIDVRNTPLH